MNELGKQVRVLYPLAVAFGLTSSLLGASQSPEASTLSASARELQTPTRGAARQGTGDELSSLDALRFTAPVNAFALPTAQVPAQPPEIPDNPNLTATLVFGAGGFFINNTATQASLQSNLGVGALVDFENVLGLETQAWVPILNARWRTSEFWRVEVEYFNLNRSGSKVLDRDITWKGQTFPAGSSVDSKFDFSDIRVSVGYSLYKTKDKEVGIALGAHVADITASIGASGASGVAGNVIAPLPVVSFYAGFAMSEHWAIAARFDAFSLKFDPYHGHLYDLGFDVLWNPWRHVGFGAGFRSLEVKGGVSASDFSGDVDTNFGGPIFYMTVAF